MAGRFPIVVVLLLSLAVPGTALGMRLVLAGYGAINSTPYDWEISWLQSHANNATHAGFGGELGVVLAENIKLAVGLAYYEEAEYNYTLIFPIDDRIRAYPVYASLRIGLPLENSPLVVGLCGGVNFAFWSSIDNPDREYHGRMGYQAGVFLELPFGDGIAIAAEGGYLALEGRTTYFSDDADVHSRGPYCRAGIILMLAIGD